MKFLPFFLCFLFAAPAFANTSAETWLHGIQSEEKLIREAIRDLSIDAQHSNREARESFKQNLEKAEIDLSKLEDKIRTTDKEKFREYASNEWKSVVQQAKSLHDYNKKGMEDLRQQLKKK